MKHSFYLIAFFLYSGSTLSYPIGGTTPSQRPVDAPTITEQKNDVAWYTHAVSGVIPPYPISLQFLEDQGGWYTPFNYKGMTGPYDIRGWHKEKSSK